MLLIITQPKDLTRNPANIESLKELCTSSHMVSSEIMFSESFEIQSFKLLPHGKFIVNSTKNHAITVNHQFTPAIIRCKIISLEQNCYKRSQAIIVTSLYCRPFSTSRKKRPKTDLEKCCQCSVSIEISLDLKISFSL